ncbi:MAG: PilN domain-containing protein [Candidatus Pacebacteria bacterium]|nr:PilN domain-containing protein [Candidatus Paceibacterota bacterium]
MINLLPPFHKQELKDDQLRLKILWMLAFSLFAFLFFMAIVFALRFYGSLKARDLLNAIVIKEQVIKNPEFQASKQIINATNQNLYKIYQTKNEQVSVSAVLEKIISLMPDSVYLTSFSFQNSFQEIQDPKTKITEKEFLANIKIGGVAQARDVLFSFKQSLSQSAEFKSVYFSPNSWVKAANADFSAELKYFPLK